MTTLDELEAVLVDRRDGDAPEGSYSVTLVHDAERAQRKIMEEAFELCRELERRSADAAVAPLRTVEEAADLLFHVVAGLVGARVPVTDVLAELDRRGGRAAGAGRAAGGQGAGGQGALGGGDPS